MKRKLLLLAAAACAVLSLAGLLSARQANTSSLPPGVNLAPDSTVTVSYVHFVLDHANQRLIDSVQLTVDAPEPGGMRISLVSDTSIWYTCLFQSGTLWSCATTSPQATLQSVTLVTVVATASQPTSVTAVAGPGSGTATVSWSAPATTGGDPITSYTVTAYINGSPTAVTATTPDGSTTTLPVAGLTNGTTYTFTVYATTIDGNGPQSSQSNAVTPQGTVSNLPGAPANVTATAGINQATVTWTPPASNGGSAITSYTITTYINGVAQGTTQVTYRATSYTLTHLTNGTTYTFTVLATNANGNGPQSAQSNPATPEPYGWPPPGAPTNVSATAGNRQATVSWTAPGSAGGSSITGYTITTYINGVAQSPTVTVNYRVTSTTISNLTNGTTYTFTVSATNSAGSGPQSIPSNAVTP